MAGFHSGRRSPPRGRDGTRRPPQRFASLAAVPVLLWGCETIVGIEGHEFGPAPSATGGIPNAAMSGGVPGVGGNGKLGGDEGNAGGADPSPPEAGAGGASYGPGGQSGESFDDDRPMVSHAEPGEAIRGVDSTSDIVISFSEPMDAASVELEYFQTDGTPSFQWSQGDSVLIIRPGLNRPTSTWKNGARPGQDSDLAVDFGVGPRARDKAGNPIVSAFSRRFYRLRHVDHWLSPCVNLSGTASAVGFDAADPAPEDVPCLEDSGDSLLKLSAGYRDGQVVQAFLSYSLRHVPGDAVLEGATLRFDFGDPIGTPHEQFGSLLLEQIVFADPGLAFGADATRSLGVLATAAVSYPHRPVKDVTSAVSEKLVEAPEGERLVQFRTRFEEAAADPSGAPAYVALDAADRESPALIVTYACAACP